MAQLLDRYVGGSGVPVPISIALALTLGCGLLIWIVRGTALRFLRSRVRNARSIERWRQITLYASILLFGLAFGGIWHENLAALSIWLDDAGLMDSGRAIGLLAAVLNVVLATAALGLVMGLLRSIRRALLVRIRAWTLKGPTIRIQRLELATPQRLGSFARRCTELVTALLLACAIGYYVLFLLSAHPATARFGQMLLGYLADAVVRTFDAVIGYLPNLFYLIVILVSIRFALKLMRLILNAVESGDVVIPGFESEWADPTFKLARVVVIAFAVMVSYPLLPGAQSEFFRGFSVFVGALVTLGSTGVMGNVISGVVLTYSGAFRVGDRVAIGKTTGTVVEKTLFVTRILSIENEVVSVPNSVVLSGTVVNLSTDSDRTALVLTVRAGIGYDVPWEHVHKLMISAARETEGILDTPAPKVWETSLDNYAVTYELRAATRQTMQIGEIRARLLRNVLHSFHGAGVEIMTPSVHAVRDGAAKAIPAQSAADNPRTS